MTRAEELLEECVKTRHEVQRGLATRQLAGWVCLQLARIEEGLKVTGDLNASLEKQAQVRDDLKEIADSLGVAEKLVYRMDALEQKVNALVGLEAERGKQEAARLERPPSPMPGHRRPEPDDI